MKLEQMVEAAELSNAKRTTDLGERNYGPYWEKLQGMSASAYTHSSRMASIPKMLRSAMPWVA
jgi:hypothetical protein